MKEKIEVVITAEQRDFLKDLVEGSSYLSSIGEAASWLIAMVLEGVKQKQGGLAISVKPWDLQSEPTERGKRTAQQVTDILGLIPTLATPGAK